LSNLSEVRLLGVGLIVLDIVGSHGLKGQSGSWGNDLFSVVDEFTVWSFDVGSEEDLILGTSLLNGELPVSPLLARDCSLCPVVDECLWR
jgi:hypothetical protein